MPFDLNFATALIENTKLPQTVAASPGLAAAAPASAPEVDLTKARDQALVVGSDVVSFTASVDPALRQAILDSSLFAQLAANQQMPGQDPIAWFDRYFSILGTLGWIIQKRDTAKWDYKGSEFGVEAIVGVITAFLAPIPGAAAAVIAILNGLHKMDADAPFITLFRRESTHGEIGRFQFTYVHQDAEIHNSLTAAWRAAEFIPKRRWNAREERREWRMNLFRRRTVMAGALVHRVAWQIGDGYASRLPATANQAG